MKKYSLAWGLIMLTAVTSFAQLKAKGDATVAESPPAAFVREKFDPARNPSDDLKAAIETASKENKRIILDVGGEWCGWCVYMIGRRILPPYSIIFGTRRIIPSWMSRT